MYCKEEVFTDAIDFIEKRVGWHQLAEPITGGSQEDFDKLVEYVKCSALLGRDRQIENLLEQYEIRREYQENKEVRELMQTKHGINHKRSMKFPFYNMSLHSDQYKKLFHGVPMKVRTKNK